MAQTPPTPQPAMRTPSEAMPAIGSITVPPPSGYGGAPITGPPPSGYGGTPITVPPPSGYGTFATPAGGVHRVVKPHVVVPPPPPPEAFEFTPPPGRPKGAEKRLPLRAAIVVPAALGLASMAGVALYLRSLSPQPGALTPLPVSPPVAEASAVQAAAQEQPVAPTTYQTANAGTTLVTVSSTPSGAAVLDVDSRLLGTTPFDLRVPTAKPLQLTLKLDGFKPLTLKKKPEGERMPLNVTLKKDPKADDLVPNRRSVGYKDDPY
jgi:hypothetical protein